MNNTIHTKLPGFTLRFANESDIPLLLHLIKSLAEYEKLSGSLKTTETDLKQNLFVNKYAEAIIAEYHGEPVGYTIFFHSFSTFLGKPGLYLEDIFIIPEMRGKKMGKIFFAYLAHLAKQRNCARLDWVVLSWNEPSIAFYKKMGANQNSEWDAYRLDGPALNQLAEEF